MLGTSGWPDDVLPTGGKPEGWREPGSSGAGAKIEAELHMRIGELEAQLAKSESARAEAL